jgi:choline-glycine betaine transporter
LNYGFLSATIIIEVPFVVVMLLFYTSVGDSSWLEKRDDDDASELTISISQQQQTSRTLYSFLINSSPIDCALKNTMRMHQAASHTNI